MRLLVLTGAVIIGHLHDASLIACLNPSLGCLSYLLQFEQFARTVGDAAVDQQRRMREAFVGFANHISSTAQDVNATWPIFRIPRYELHAAQVRLQSGMEYIGCQYLIEPNDAAEYLKFVNANYEDSMVEGHMTRYGNLDRLIPIGYTPNFTIGTATGIIPDPVMDRPLRSATWQISPRKYCSFLTTLLLDLEYCHLNWYAIY